MNDYRARAAAARVTASGPIALLLAAFAGGCLTTERLMRSRGQGEVRCYRGDFDLVWEAVGRSIVLNGLQLDEADRGERYVLARSAPGLEPRAPEDMAVDSDAGERVAVFVDSAGPAVWAVQVVSRANFALDPGARTWTGDVYEVLERTLPDSARRPWHFDYPRCWKTYPPPGPP